MSAIAYADREVTKPPDWHGLVVCDLFLNAVTTGLFLTAAAAELLRPELFAPVTRWVYPVALGVLVLDLLCLVFDLGDPLKFHHMLRVFKPSSPMSLGTWSLTAYSLPLTLVVALDAGALAGVLPSESAAVALARKLVLAGGLVPAFLSVLYKGVLFSTTAQPGWRDARWLGGYHVASALALGAGGLLVAAVFTGAADAARPLRWAALALGFAQLAPLELLLRQLAPAVRRAGGRPKVVRLSAVGIGATAAGLALVAAGGSLAGAGVVVIAAAAWFVRAEVVRLPHAGH